MTPHTPIPDIKDNHIVEQFARSLVSHYMGESWKWKDEEYQLTVKCLREKITHAFNSHDTLLLAAKDAAVMIASIYKEALYGDMKKFRDSPTVDNLLKAIAHADGK